MSTTSNSTEAGEKASDAGPKSGKVDKDVEAVTAEIRRLRSDMSSLVDTIGHVGRRRARHLADTAQGKADEGMAAGEAMLAEAQTELERIERDLATATRRSPFRALGIAAGLGFLLALIVRR
jgi:ElaB/YqjD/DUF883 family membrane-anchored ribosome-binding protein